MGRGGAARGEREMGSGEAGGGGHERRGRRRRGGGEGGEARVRRESGGGGGGKGGSDRRAAPGCPGAEKKNHHQGRERTNSRKGARPHQEGACDRQQEEGGSWRHFLLSFFLGFGGRGLGGARGGGGN